jgi:hypothetical protein
MQRVLHSVFTGRVVLNIHAHSRIGEDNASLIVQSHGGYTASDRPVILVDIGSEGLGRGRSGSLSKA